MSSPSEGFFKFNGAANVLFALNISKKWCVACAAINASLVST
jgi:hypothetical protein